MHDGVGARDDRVGGPGVREVRPLVAAGHDDARVEDRRHEIDAEHVVTRLDEGEHGGSPDLAPGPGDDDLHVLDRSQPEGFSTGLPPGAVPVSGSVVSGFGSLMVGP